MIKKFEHPVFKHTQILQILANAFFLVLLLGDHTVGVIDYGITDTEDGASNSVILDLEDSDQVYLQLYDGRELYSSHYRFTTFSGFLIFEA